MKICGIEGCGRTQARKGLCKRHADQSWRAQNPDKVKAQKNRWNAANRERTRISNKKWRTGHRKTYRRSLRGLWAHSQQSANHRGIVWAISFEDYSGLRKLPCHYCQFSLPVAGSGLDRIDNVRGYERTNVVPCCADCNITRGNRYSHVEMVEIGALLRKLKLRRMIQIVAG